LRWAVITTALESQGIAELLKPARIRLFTTTDDINPERRTEGIKFLNSLTNRAPIASILCNDERRTINDRTTVLSDGLKGANGNGHQAIADIYGHPEFPDGDGHTYADLASECTLHCIDAEWYDHHRVAEVVAGGVGGHGGVSGAVAGGLPPKKGKEEWGPPGGLLRCASPPPLVPLAKPAAVRWLACRAGADLGVALGAGAVRMHGRARPGVLDGQGRTSPRL
jgi:hypothetical protein